MDSGLRRRIHRYGGKLDQPLSDPETSYPGDDDHAFFTPGRDFESIYTNHKYTGEERRTLSAYESVDYLPAHSGVYCAWLRRQPRRLDWDRWLMMALIGFSVGFVGFLLHQFIDLISETKWEHAQAMLEDGGLLAAWGFVLGYSAIFVAAAAALVLLRPSAAGSGIPELIGFLNGTMVRHIFNLKTLGAKFVSCCCAVGGGLPIGPEGPMIHMGSLIGAGVSQFKSDTLGLKLPFFQRFRNSEDRRNFVSAGAAAGVAAAFGAPVGGLLFSMEEVSSFWNMRLSWQTFFCCMVSTFTNDLFNSAFDKFQYRGQFGLFKLQNYILFQVHKGIPINVLVFLPTIVLGLLCGLLGALFTIVNLKLARLRRRLLAWIGAKSVPVQKAVRFSEPLVVILLFSTVCVLLPQAFPCAPFQCGVEKNNTERLSLNCLTDSGNPLHVEPNVVRYLCPRGQVWREGSMTATNDSYNEAATLLFLTGEKAIRHLFSRNTHFELGFPALVTVLLLYFLAACWACGTAVSSGLVVPMLMIGGLVGRMVGLAMVKLFGLHTGGEADLYWAWIDPGAFALIGAAAFFGGVSRLTMSLTVIMMEITNDVQFLLPIMVGIMVAKWLGDLITHPLYHSLLELKCIPFLDAEPVVMHESQALNLELYSVSDVMSSPVTTLRVREKVSVIAEALLASSHSGFPVVAPHFNSGLPDDRSSASDDEMPDRLLGSITRLELVVLLRLEHRFSREQSEESIEEGEDPDVDYTDLTLDKLADPQAVSQRLETLAMDEHYARLWLDLRPFINRSAVSVRDDFSLHRAYILVRSLGLRHLIVTDRSNRVQGLVTRKDLMGFALEERLEPLLRRQLGFIDNPGFSELV